MNNIICLEKYNTDMKGAWGTGEQKFDSTLQFDDILKYTIKLNASVILRNTNQTWYIKGINGKKSFNDIEHHIKKNVLDNYRPKSNLWLITYIKV